jgi:hypothetical protein
LSDAAGLLRASLARVREGLPYPGFRPFRRDEWPIFFGRERQVQALLALLAAHRFICIHGPSGCGKSSLIEAGLIATLQREHARLDTTWCASTFRPGVSPMWNLARGILRALRPDVEPGLDAVVEAYSLLNRPGGSIPRAAHELGLAANANLLLIADQFEELFRFRALGDRREAQRFLDLLLGVFDEQPPGIHVVLATRTDFLGDCSDVVGLAEAVNAAPYLTPALTEDELRTAISGPAELHGGHVDDALVEAMLADSADAPDRLPILQHTLMRCWDVAQRHNAPGKLTLELYRSPAIGSVLDALDRHAEEVMASLELAGLEREVEATFKALTELDGQGRPIRRPLQWSQLCAETAGDPLHLERLVNRFRAEGTGFLGRPGPEEKELKPDTVVDVAHEALIRRWRRISRPARAGTGRQREGWLWDQAADGNLYRALLLDAGSESETVGAEILDGRLAWWRRQPRTAAWARRMAANREASDQEALDGVGRIDELFRRSEMARRRQRLSRRLGWATTVISVVAVIAALVVKLVDDQRAATADIKLAEAQANEQLQKRLAEQSSNDLVSYITKNSALVREIEQLRAAQTTTAVQVPTSPDQPAVPTDQSEVTPSVRQSLQRAIAPAAGPSPSPTPAPAASQNCKGAMWIGANNLVNLRFAGADADRRVTLADIQPERHFISTKNVRLRQAPPGEGYTQQEAIGIVPEGAEVVALRQPTIIDRSGKQYWLEVGVSGQVCSLVYFQFAGAPADSARFKSALEKQGYLVPGQEQLSSAQGIADVRYYYAEDRGSAEQLARDAMADAKALGLAGGRQITLRDLTSWPEQKKPPRGTLELWLDLSKS